MSKTKNKKASQVLTVVTNIICAVLMLAFVACHFLPFWSYETIEGEDKTAAILGIATEEGEVVEKTISLADYVWMTEEHDDLFGDWRNMKTSDGQRIEQNDIVIMPFLCTLLTVFGVVFCLLKRDKTWVCLFPLISGVLAVVTYLTNPILQTGMNWQIHLVAACVLTVAALVQFVQWAISIHKWFTVKKY